MKHKQRICIQIGLGKTVKSVCVMKQKKEILYYLAVDYKINKIKIASLTYTNINKTNKQQ